MHKLKKKIPFVVLRMLGGMIPSTSKARGTTDHDYENCTPESSKKRRILKLMVLPSQNHDKNLIMYSVKYMFQFNNMPWSHTFKHSLLQFLCVRFEYWPGSIFLHTQSMTFCTHST
jgi:hypothetical protein